MAISFPFASNLISSKYGPRVWNGAQTVHTGVDFAVSGNRAIPAADEGTITKIEYTNLKGYQVEIQHSAAARTRYHMLRSDVLDTVTVGQYVSKGQTIGHIAPVRYNPAAAWKGPHLHWEVWLRLVRSDGSPYDSWRHVDPQQRWTNAGGPNGYTPTEPSNTGPATGGGTTPIESDDMFSDGDRAMLREVRDLFTPGQAGVKHDGDIFRSIESLKSELAKVLNLLTPGQAGVRGDGDIFRRIQSIETKINSLASAVGTASAEATAAKDHSLRAADSVSPGQSGVRHDGVLFALTKKIDNKIQ